MKSFAKLCLLATALFAALSCNNKHSYSENKLLELHWSNPDICTTDSILVEADIIEFCGRTEIASHHIDTLKCNLIESYEANPKTDKVRIRLFFTDFTLEHHEEPLPLWVDQVYKFESDTLTINFTNEDYKISPFKP